MSVEEKVSQEDMRKQFQERLENLQNENKKLAQQIRDNEGVALKLLGAIEALSYYLDSQEEQETMSHPPDEVDEVTVE
tara:strand:- start:1295 stop:1528 length:234 start_codon:yes stop_codon:yes gene_type:complete